ncbi:hypothetical protein RHSIM_Rhsim09G0047900 [Rhododendron simsii]|uniref:GATA-type domain-containing protein n=1 Tax=Rhododendron simsii TaxID=118357 RepID=A0A834GEE8_RHOSS|nr:hypothetical protein RHSIM_Rhsim09G0047900 [Rhododendron simsii]
MEARIMVEDLLNFTLDVGEGDYHYDENTLKAPSSTTSNSQDPDDTEHAEEELEWLLNKDAFPSVETCFDILTPNPSIAQNQHSPVSVLDPTTTTSSISISTTSCCGGSSSILTPARYPMKPRSKRRRPRRPGALANLANQQYWHWSQVDAENSKQQLRVTVVPPKAPEIGRRCQHCGADKTPQWRAGPMGPKTLCNACGVRYKSGRLVPEYRPASSPTFSSLLHSNSHRKVMEMRRQKQMG